jgi:hypothetical protein
MSGGVLSALETLSPDDVRKAAEAFSWFGLQPEAEFVLESLSQLENAVQVDAALDALELQFDREYTELVPTDQTLVAAFESRLRSEPEAFSALA